MKNLAIVCIIALTISSCNQQQKDTTALTTENVSAELSIQDKVLKARAVEALIWAMPMLNTGGMQKGNENANTVEILSPKLTPADVIIQKGAYGLPDSTKVKIN